MSFPKVVVVKDVDNYDNYLSLSIIMVNFPKVMMVKDAR